MYPLSLPAPAKINWFLHIIGQREDGYHLLQTGFQFLDYGDQLSFSPRQDGQVVVTGSEIVPQEENLVFLAAQRLKAYVPDAYGVTVVLHKKIPMGAGLGGGSSDAATTLVALNHMWRLGLTQAQLMEIGLGLGADVPVFVFGQAAFAEGIGEKLQVYHRQEHPCLVVIPDAHVSTAKMYAEKNLTRNSKRLELAQLETLELKNDFEPLVRSLYPAVEGAFQWLLPHGRPKLSGSGAAVFLECETLAKAYQLLAQLPPSLTGFVAFEQNVSPLYHWGIAKW